MQTTRKKIDRSKMSLVQDKSALVEQNLEERMRRATEEMKNHPFMPTANAPAQTGNQDVVAEHNREGGRFESVPIELIDQNPYNARNIYRPERVTELADSIGAHGQDVPAIATKRNGRYVLAAGHYRLRAIKLLNLKTMDLMVHENLSDTQLYSYSYRENAEREAQTAIDNAISWRKMLDDGLFENDIELAEVVGLNKATISKTLGILKLSEKVLDIVKEDPSAFGATVLYELMLFETASNDQEKTAEMAKLIQSGELSRQGIVDEKDKVSDERQRKKKETSRPYKFNKEGAFQGALKVWDSGRVMLDVTIINSEERESILSEIKKRFDITG